MHSLATLTANEVFLPRSLSVPDVSDPSGDIASAMHDPLTFDPGICDPFPRSMPDDVLPTVKDAYAEELAAVTEAMAEKLSYETRDIGRLPKRLRLILKSERQTRVDLKTRGPEQWRKAIAAIKDPTVRARVACIVWWDYFASRTIRERWPHLDEYLAKPFVRVPTETLRRGLFAVGYTALQAHDRIHETYYQKQPYTKKKGHHNAN